MVRRGLVIACRLAGSPTRRSPLSVKATTDGVRRLPSWLGMTFTSLPSMTATTEFVVPKSMPIIFSCAIGVGSFLNDRSQVGPPLGPASGSVVMRVETDVLASVSRPRGEVRIDPLDNSVRQQTPCRERIAPVDHPTPSDCSSYRMDSASAGG